MTRRKAERVREGLMLCMLLASCVEGERELELREMSLAASEEPEFTAEGEGADEVLGRVQKDLHRAPDEILEIIATLLDSEELRQRGLALAARVAVADGKLGSAHLTLLEEMTERLDLTPEYLTHTLVAAQRRAVRFAMVCLMYLTATADGRVRAEELEEMIPFALNLPTFRGIASTEFKGLAQSCCRNLATIRDTWGVDGLCGTLTASADMMQDETIPTQALRMVARGIFADGEVRPRERDFFQAIARKLRQGESVSNTVMETVARESREQLRKL